MTKAIYLISVERDEQINKHGFTAERDTLSYDEELTGKFAEPSDLVDAAIATINGGSFPAGWLQTPYPEIIRHKTYRDRLIVAAALLAAEIDRHIKKFGE